MNPWRILLIGPPNVGKSRLLNAIAGHERAIVSAEAGTTRDLIHAEISIDGWPFIFADGAGIRTSVDEIEQAGIALLKREAETVDLCLLIHDLSQPNQINEEIPITAVNHLLIGNKSDLDSPWREEDKRQLDLLVSAMTGEGIDSLLAKIVERIVPRSPAPRQPVPFTQRQVDNLDRLLRRK